MLRLKIHRHLAQFALDIDLTCPYPVTAVYGPSGAGKTTLLNAIAGLVRPDDGEIALDDKTLFSSANSIDLPPEQRRIGYVFQDDLLFPHLSVQGNLRYGFDRLPAAQRRFHLEQIVELLEIGPLLARKPAHLSGGEAQRVALGRALLTSPRLLLMDEPLASLDQGLKSRIIPYLRHIRADLGIPILYVSHAVAEILELTGQVIVLQGGQVVAHGDFFRIAHHPDVLPLMEEHGFENVLPVEIIEANAAAGFSRARCGEQILKIPYCDRPLGHRLFAGLRADDIILARHRPEGLSLRNALQGRITEISDISGKELVYVDVGRRLAVKVTSEAIAELGLQVGDQVFCLIKTHSIRLGPEVE
ncbi:MAG: molybdenum ABC transporter ATP-binding protein [Candidatus Latescibacteria bacterium]|nr:molybdenum ABC transporter ATP-binding protein [Candidatus Latescibacterota bacterium]